MNPPTAASGLVPDELQSRGFDCAGFSTISSFKFYYFKFSA